MKIVLIILLYSSVLNAQLQSKDSLSIEANRTKSLLDIKLYQDSFLSDTGELPSSYNNIEIGLRRYSPNGLNIKGSLQYSLDESEEPYIDVQDFNISFNTNWSFVKSYLGRKTIAWSEMDVFWGLGAWEPYGTQNPIEPRRQGLTGLFFDVKINDRAKLVLFGSTVSIPSSGPKFTYENNKISSKNPWFHDFVDESLELGISESEILYDLNIPPYEEVFIQNSYGLQAEISSLSGNWLKGSYSHKPMNQFIYQAYNGAYDASLKKSVVSLKPTSFYHDLYTVEAGVKRNRFDMWISFTHDRPILDSEKVAENLNYIDPLYTSNIYSAYFDFSLSNNQKLYLGYLRREDLNNLTKFDIESSIVIENSSESIQNRYLYSDLIQLGYKFNIGSTITNLSYSYSAEDEGDIFKANINYYFKNGVTFFSDLVVLSKFGDTGESFFDKNKANDYVKVGMEYVF